MALYKIDVDVSDYDRILKKFIGINNKFADKNLLDFIAKKSFEVLKRVSLENLSSVNEENLEKSLYMMSNQWKLDGEDTIVLFNDSEIDISSKDMSQEKKSKYPNLKISLSKIVEYGIGYTGGSKTAIKPSADEWQYDINQHGYKGWYYKDENGNIVWTNGFEGRLIFYKTKQEIEKNINKWISQYVNSKKD